LREHAVESTMVTPKMALSGLESRGPCRGTGCWGERLPAVSPPANIRAHLRCAGSAGAAKQRHAWILRQPASLAPDGYPLASLRDAQSKMETVFATDSERAQDRSRLAQASVHGVALFGRIGDNPPMRPVGSDYRRRTAPGGQGQALPLQGWH